jgi:hypothetical protein
MATITIDSAYYFLRFIQSDVENFGYSHLRKCITSVDNSVGAPNEVTTHLRKNEVGVVVHELSLLVAAPF